MLLTSYQKTVHGPDWGWLMESVWVHVCILCRTLGARKHKENIHPKWNTKFFVKVPRFLDVPPIQKMVWERSEKQDQETTVYAIVRVFLSLLQKHRCSKKVRELLDIQQSSWLLVDWKRNSSLNHCIICCVLSVVFVCHLLLFVSVDGCFRCCCYCFFVRSMIWHSLVRGPANCIHVYVCVPLFIYLDVVDYFLLFF